MDHFVFGYILSPVINLRKNIDVPLFFCTPSDPINADILTNGRCVHPELNKFNLIISGRDWCNLFDEIPQEQIDQMQEKAMQSEQ